MSFGCNGECGCESFSQDIINGQDGAQGAPGESAYQLAVDQGFVGTIDQWIASLSGQSAYQLAVTLGFVGTEAQWIASLQGTDGTDGAPGDNAWTVTTADFAMPTIGSQTAVGVVNGNFQVLGQRVFVQNAGYMRQFGINVGNPVTLVVFRNEATSYTSQAAPGTVISAGARVTTAGEDGATGAQGIPGTNGSPGTAGTTPFLRTGTGAPSNGLGVNGDLYLQRPNSGTWILFARQSGVYVNINSILTTQAIGNSTTTDPNSGGVVGNNVNDQYWTYIGTFVTLWFWNGSSWTSFFSFNTAGGGGGTGTYQATSAASPAGPNGALMGTIVLNLQRSLQMIGLPQATVSAGATVVFNTDYQKHFLSVLHDVRLNWSTIGAGLDSVWTFELINNSAAERSIKYTTGRWTVCPDQTLVEILPIGETASFTATYIKGFLNIDRVRVNLIPVFTP